MTIEQQRGHPPSAIATSSGVISLICCLASCIFLVIHWTIRLRKGTGAGAAFSVVVICSAAVGRFGPEITANGMIISAWTLASPKSVFMAVKLRRGRSAAVPCDAALEWWIVRCGAHSNTSDYVHEKFFVACTIEHTRGHVPRATQRG